MSTDRIRNAQSTTNRPGHFLSLIGLVMLLLGPAGVAKVDAHATRGSGGVLWLDRYDKSVDGGRGVVVSPDGSRVYVTGQSAKPRSEYDYLTVAYEPSTGARLWTARWDGPGSRDDEPRSVAVSPDGTRVFVTGQSGEVGTYDAVTIAYKASTGKQLWMASYVGTGRNDVGRGVAVSPNGDTVYVAGTSEGPASGVDVFAAAYDASTGKERWVRRYDGSGHGDDFANGLTVGAAGST
jgi:DNA-binding beta-propeller fold protein YncE